MRVCVCAVCMPWMDCAFLDDLTAWCRGVVVVFALSLFRALQEGEQCYLLFDPSEKEKLPSVMLDQAKVAAALSDSKPASAVAAPAPAPAAAQAASAPAAAAAAGTGGGSGSKSDAEMEKEQLRSTVSAQQAEIERLQAELVRTRSDISSCPVFAAAFLSVDDTTTPRPPFALPSHPRL